MIAGLKMEGTFKWRGLKSQGPVYQYMIYVPVYVYIDAKSIQYTNSILYQHKYTMVHISCTGICLDVR